MPWLSSGLDSASHYKRAGQDLHRTLGQETELIRKAMLECLDGDASQLADGLARKIYLANDATRLWHLRGQVMTALALRRGEALAREKIASIDPLFRQVLPEGPAQQLFGALHQRIQRGDPT